MRRPRADREEKRVTHGRDMKNDEQLGSDLEGKEWSMPLQCVT
jgi:hypothetical protein